MVLHKKPRLKRIKRGFCQARPEGLEPTTFWSEARRSIQLSYGRSFQKNQAVVLKNYSIYEIIPSYLRYKSKIMI